MKIIEVPIFNEDGTVKVTTLLSPEEAQHILQFAINFLMSAGMAANYAIQHTDDNEQGELFEPSSMQ